MTLPEYEFLSAPLWLITALHWLTLTLHFIAMNFLFGGTLVLLISRLDNKWQLSSVQKYVKALPTVMAATVTLGVAPLLFLQLTYHQPVYSAAIVSGWFWLFIIIVAILTYYFVYGSAFSTEKAPGRLSGLLIVAVLGLFYISLVYSSIFSMAERPDLMHKVYAGTQSGGVVNPDVGSYLFRWLHMVFGALTVGGFFVGLLGRKEPSVYDTGRRAFLIGMIGTALAGLVYLFTLGDFLTPFMRSAGIWTLTVGVLLSLGSLHFYFKKKFLPAGAMVFASMFLMVVTRHVLRQVRLDGVWDPANIPLHPQWWVFLVFLVCFLLALALVAYMLHLYFRSDQRTAA